MSKVSDATATLESRIDESGVERVLLEFPDLNGISRSKQVSAEYFIENWRGGFAMPVAIIAVSPATMPAEGSGWASERNYAEGLLRPVPETFTEVPWLGDAGRVLCEWEHDGEPVAADPRMTLRRTLDRLGTDLDFTTGSEFEFYLLDTTEDGYEPATPGPHEHVSWATEEGLPFYRELEANARDYAIDLNLLHHEWGPGQFEVLFEYGDPLAEADRAFDFRRLVNQTARMRGQRATFMAKPFADQSGSGYHLHVSARDADGENAFAYDGDLSETGRQFVGGLCEHADALVALQAGSFNAYKRYEPGSFVPYTASWGFNNRFAAVRITGDEPRIELRVGSADANPYVVVASTLAAGVHGIEAGLDPGDPADGDPAGERPELARRPELALHALEDDDVLVDALGEGFVRAYVATRRREIEDFYDTVTDWERDLYVEMF